MEPLHELAEDIKTSIYWKIEELEKLDEDMDKLKTLSEKFEEIIDDLYEHGFTLDENRNHDEPEFCIEISHNDNRNRKYITSVKDLEELFTKEDLIEELKKELKV